MRANLDSAERTTTFEVERDFASPDLRTVIGRTRRLPEKHVRTTYFDTPDRRLALVDLTLRHSQELGPEEHDGGEGGEGGTWVLEPQGRGEDDDLSADELSWDGALAEVPAAVLTVLQGILRHAVLRPLVELGIDRRRLLLYLPDKTTVFGELDDDLVRVVDGPNEGMSFRQIEAELEGSSGSQASVVLDSLRRSGARPGKRSKLVVALGEELAPDAGDNGKNRRRETIEETARAALRAGLDRLLRHDYRLRLRPEQPAVEDVHQARVATRRLRSDLKTLGPILDPVWTAHTRDDLRWIGRILGGVRDVDVRSADISRHLAEMAAEATEHDPILRVLQLERQAAVTDLADAMASDRYITLLDRLSAAQHLIPALEGVGFSEELGFGPRGRASKVLPNLVGKQWRRLRKKVRKAGHNPDNETLHEIRIKAKQLRYAAEVATPVIGKPAARTASRAEEIQSVLGDLHDTVTAEEWLRAQVGRLTPEAAFTAGILCGAQRRDREQLRGQWHSEWSKLRRQKNLSWMRS